MPAAVCGKTMGRSMTPSSARLPGKSSAGEQVRQRHAEDEADGGGDERRRDGEDQGAAHVVLPQRLAEQPAPAPTIMLAAGSTTKVTSTAPATAQSAQNREMRRPGIRAGEAGAGGTQGLPGACGP